MDEKYVIICKKCGCIRANNPTGNREIRKEQCMLCGTSEVFEKDSEGGTIATKWYRMETLNFGI